MTGFELRFIRPPVITIVIWFETQPLIKAYVQIVSLVLRQPVENDFRIYFGVVVNFQPSKSSPPDRMPLGKYYLWWVFRHVQSSAAAWL